MQHWRKKKTLFNNKNKKKTAKIRSEKMKQKTVKQQQLQKNFTFQQEKKKKKKKQHKKFLICNDLLWLYFCFFFFKFLMWKLTLNTLKPMRSHINPYDRRLFSKWKILYSWLSKEIHKYITVLKKRIKVILKKKSFLKNTKTIKKKFLKGWMNQPTNQKSRTRKICWIQFKKREKRRTWNNINKTY